jgi:hypothetical protein
MHLWEIQDLFYVSLKVTMVKKADNITVFPLQIPDVHSALPQFEFPPFLS